MGLRRDMQRQFPQFTGGLDNLTALEDEMPKLGRRDFLKAGGIATAETFLARTANSHLLAEVQGEPAKPVTANDHIQIALIGAGSQGQYDMKVAL